MALARVSFCRNADAGGNAATLSTTVRCGNRPAFWDDVADPPAQCDPVQGLGVDAVEFGAA